MKRIGFFCVLLLISASLFSQGLSKKQIRQNKDSIAFANLNQLVASKDFEFVATQALPQSGPSIVLSTGEYTVRIKNDSIFSSLPFYGRAYQVIPGERGGFHFEEAISDYKVEYNKKKKRIDIQLKVKLKNDLINYHFSFSDGDSASLTVLSNNRSNMSFWGKIEKPDPKE